MKPNLEQMQLFSSICLFSPTSSDPDEEIKAPVKGHKFISIWSHSTHSSVAF